MDLPRAVMVQLGEPLTWQELGAGLVASGDTLSATTSNAQRCALTRALSGSWMAAVRVVSAAAGATAFRVGIVPSEGRQTLAQRRPVNQRRPQDWNLTTSGRHAIVVDRNGAVWRNGLGVGSVSPAPATGSTIYLLHDASARTLTIRINNATTGGLTVTNVDGPVRIAANGLSSATSLRLMHDVDVLPRMLGYRPAGVWGRVSTIGLRVGDVLWDGCIATDGDPTFELSAGFAVMGNGRRSASVGDITVINAPHLYGQRRQFDDWLTWQVRDEPITISRRVYGEVLGGEEVVAQGVVDSISEPREGRLAVSCRDKSALLDIPWQAETYPDSTPLVSLRGRSKPTVAGSCRAAPLVMTDAAQLLYDVTDDAWASAPSLVYDRGVQLTSGVGYSASIDGKTLQRLTNPDGLQCATVTAGTTDLSVGIGATVGDFVQWSTAFTPVPLGWAVNISGSGASIGPVVPQGVRFLRDSNSGIMALYTTAPVFDAPGTYRVDIELGNINTGSALYIQRTNSTASTSSGISTITSAHANSKMTIIITIGAPGAINHLRLYANVAGLDHTIRSIRVARVQNVSTIAQHALYAASYRGPLPESDIDVASFSFPDAASMPLCLHTGPGDNRTVLRVLDHLLASVGGGWYFDALGKLRGVLLEDPEDVATRWQTNGWPILRLDDVNLIGDVSSRLDEAGGLTTRVAGDPTWAVHSPSDIASSLYTSSAGRTLADTLMADYAAIATGATTVAADYRHAEQAEPFASLLSTSAGAQLLANRLTALYRKQRRLVTVRAALDDSLAVRPGHPIQLVHAGLTNYLLCLSNRGRFSSDTADLILWG